MQAKSRHRMLSVLVGLICTLTILAGCTFVDSSSKSNSEDPIDVDLTAVPIDAPMPEFPEELGVFYRQGVSWSECGDGLVCGTYVVPLDYADPSGKVIRIAAMKHKATGERIGSLLVNPGGPGGSGQELASVAAYYFPQEIVEHFDIVGFDPRGVGESHPIECLPDDELSDLVEASYPDTPEGKAASEADSQKIAQGCGEKSGDILPFVGTANVARDMDVMRAVEGDPKLYYVGFSYGTELGAEYAHLFPKNAGRLVLDGAMSSTLTNYEQSRDQLLGFENSLNQYLEHCLNEEKRCPFTGTLDDARVTVADLFEKALREPLPVSGGGEPLTEAGLLYGMITPLYTSDYETLTRAFEQLINENDASLFHVLFESYLGREDGEFQDNSFVSNIAVTCADFPAEGDKELWAQQAEQLNEESPLFGPVFGYDGFVCANWPYQPTERVGNFKATGSDPIVVIGTTGDPATPYSWAQDLASSLDNATLVTWEGEGHTAYGRSTDCVTLPINAYLLNGSVPKDGLTCPAE